MNRCCMGENRKKGQLQNNTWASWGKAKKPQLSRRRTVCLLRYALHMDQGVFGGLKGHFVQQSGEQNTFYEDMPSDHSYDN